MDHGKEAALTNFSDIVDLSSGNDSRAEVSRQVDIVRRGSRFNGNVVEVDVDDH